MATKTGASKLDIDKYLASSLDDLVKQQKNSRGQAARDARGNRGTGRGNRGAVRGGRGRGFRGKARAGNQRGGRGAIRGARLMSTPNNQFNGQIRRGANRGALSRGRGYYQPARAAAPTIGRGSKFYYKPKPVLRLTPKEHEIQVRKAAKKVTPLSRGIAKKTYPSVVSRRTPNSFPKKSTEGIFGPRANLSYTRTKNPLLQQAIARTNRNLKTARNTPIIVNRKAARKKPTGAFARPSNDYDMEEDEGEIVYSRPNTQPMNRFKQSDKDIMKKIKIVAALDRIPPALSVQRSTHGPHSSSMSTDKKQPMSLSDRFGM